MAKKKRRDYKLSNWAKKVKKLQGNKCLVCGSKKKLEAHHIWDKHTYPKKKYDIKNGATLCRKCHRTGWLAYHKVMGQKSTLWSYTLWYLGRKMLNIAKKLLGILLVIYIASLIVATYVTSLKY